MDDFDKLLEKMMKNEEFKKEYDCPKKNVILKKIGMTFF